MTATDLPEPSAPDETEAPVVPGIPVPPDDERFPALYLFIHHLQIQKKRYFHTLLQRLIALHSYLHEVEGSPDATTVHQRWTSVQNAIGALQELGIWGVEEKQAQAISLLESEVTAAFPKPAPPAGSGPSEHILQDVFGR